MGDKYSSWKFKKNKNNENRKIKNKNKNSTRLNGLVGHLRHYVFDAVVQYQHDYQPSSSGFHTTDTEDRETCSF